MENEQIINMSINVAKSGSKRAIKIMEDSIVETKDLLLITDFAAKVKGADIERLEKIIANSLNPEAIYNFAKNVEGADLGKLKAAMLKVSFNQGYPGFLKYTYLHNFAKDFPQLGTTDLDELAIKADIPHLSYLFAKDIEGANIEAHQAIVLKHPDAEYITNFARDVKGADIKELEDALLKYINVYKRDKNYAYVFGLIEGADIEPLAEYAVNNCSHWINYQFARDIVKDVQKNKQHEKVVLETCDAECLVAYGNDVFGADKKAIEDKLISSQYATLKDLYYLAINLNGADVTKIRNAMYNRFADTNGYERTYLDEIDKAEETYKKKLLIHQGGLIDATGD